MSPTRWVFAAACGALSLSAAPALRAQSPLLLELFAARRQASTAPFFGGLGLAGYRGPFGLRVTGSLNLGDRANTGGTSFADDQQCRGLHCWPGGGFAGTQETSLFGLGGWTADADLVVEPLRAVPALRALLLGFSPYAFGGVGRYAVRPTIVADTSVTGLSYGVGVRHQLLGALGVSAEARFRRALSGNAAVSTVALRQNAQWRTAQYRVGLTVSFGGRRAARASAPAPAPVALPAPAPRDAAPLPPPVAAAPAARVTPRVLDLADGLVNTPYRAGGSTPASGFDAAGFVQYVFGREGVALPGTVGGLAEAGTAVAARAGALVPGDLLLFANDGSTVDHVAIYVGRDRFIHATASGGAVRYDVLGEGARGRWFADHLVGVRRVVAEPDGARRGGDAAPPPGAPAR